MAETKKSGSLTSSISNAITGAASQIIVCIVIALATVCIRSNDQSRSIQENKTKLIDLSASLRDMNNTVVVLETKMSSRDADIVKLQNTVDRLNEKVASIPDRNEFNESLNNLYNRLMKLNK